MSKRAREDDDPLQTDDDERKDGRDEDKVLATRWGGWLQNLQDMVVDDWRTEALKTAVFVEAIQAMEQCENWIQVATVAIRLRGKSVVDQANSPLLDELVNATKANAEVDAMEEDDFEDNQYLRTLAATGTKKSWTFLMSRKYPPILADLKGCLRAALERGNLQTMDFFSFPWKPQYARWALKNGRDFAALHYLRKGDGLADVTNSYWYPKRLIVTAASNSCEDTVDWLLQRPATLVHKRRIAKFLEEHCFIDELARRSDTKMLQKMVNFGVDVKESFWECIESPDPVKVAAWFLTTYPDLDPWQEEPHHYEERHIPYLAYILRHRPRDREDHQLAFQTHLRCGSSVGILKLLWRHANTPAFRARFVSDQVMQGLILNAMSECQPEVMAFLLDDVGCGMSTHPEQIIAFLLLIHRDCITQVCLDKGLVIPVDCSVVLAAVDRVTSWQRGYAYPSPASLRSILFDRGGDPASCTPYLLASASTWSFRRCLPLLEAGVPAPFPDVARCVSERVVRVDRYNNYSVAVYFLAKVLATQNTPANCALFLEFVSQAPYPGY